MKIVANNLANITQQIAVKSRKGIRTPASTMSTPLRALTYPSIGFNIEPLIGSKHDGTLDPLYRCSACLGY